MLQKYEKINFRTNGINLYEITNNIIDWINKTNLSSGLLNISIQHTSASLLLQENADPTVLEDLKNYFNCSKLRLIKCVKSFPCSRF